MSWHSVVCVLVTTACSAKMAEPIEMPFGLLTHVGLWNHVLFGGRYGRHLVNIIEQSMLRSISGCRYIYCSNLFLFNDRTCACFIWHSHSNALRDRDLVVLTEYIYKPTWSRFLVECKASCCWVRPMMLTISYCRRKIGSSCMKLPAFSLFKASFHLRWHTQDTL